MFKDGTKKTLLWGLSTFVVVLLLHFIVFLVTIGFTTGFVQAIMSAIGLAVLALAVTLVLTLASRDKEGLFKGYFLTLSVLILGNLLRMIFGNLLPTQLGL